MWRYLRVGTKLRFSFCAWVKILFLQSRLLRAKREHALQWNLWTLWKPIHPMWLAFFARSGTWCLASTAWWLLLAQTHTIPMNAWRLAVVATWNLVNLACTTLCSPVPRPLSLKKAVEALGSSPKPVASKPAAKPGAPVRQGGYVRSISWEISLSTFLTWNQPRGRSKRPLTKRGRKVQDLQPSVSTGQPRNVKAYEQGSI